MESIKYGGSAGHTEPPCRPVDLVLPPRPGRKLPVRLDGVQSDAAASSQDDADQPEVGERRRGATMRVRAI